MTAPTANKQIAELFHQMAELLEIHGETPFRSRAYRRAAIFIGNLQRDVSTLSPAELDALPGVGKALAGQIREICTRGGFQSLTDIKARTGPGLLALSALPGLGPKRVRLLQTRLDVTDTEGLAAAAAAGKLRDLPHFGRRLETALLESLRPSNAAS